MQSSWQRRFTNILLIFCGRLSIILSQEINPSTYCSQPANLNNGAVLCCSGTGSSQNSKDFCCRSNDEVQFECNPGYSLLGEPQWRCGDNGYWLYSRLPTCVLNSGTDSSHTESSSLSDGMVRTVVGVASGVLSLLLVVIVLAFCKPRLKDIKRRWMDLREDENGLIINGQRVLLPTYEEATTNSEQGWYDPHHQIVTPACLNALTSSQGISSSDAAVTRPPESNAIVDDLIVLSLPSSVVNTNSYSDSSLRDQLSRIEPLPSRDDLMVTASPSTSGDAHVETAGFDDSFVAISGLPCQKDQLSSLHSITENSNIDEGVVPTLRSAELLKTSQNLDTQFSNLENSQNIVNDHSNETHLAENQRDDLKAFGNKPSNESCPVDDDGTNVQDFSNVSRLDLFTLTGNTLSPGSFNQCVSQCENTTL